jgi:putative pyrroloquinoline-quinone binding quinoprotein/type IX secretion system substrate protein
MLFRSVVFAGDWVTIGGNSMRNGLSPDTGPLTNNLLWNRYSPQSFTGHQIFTFGTKFVTSRHTLSPLAAVLACHDLITGDTLWVRNYAPNGVMIVMGFNNNRIYARNFQQQGFDSIYAINPNDGSVFWRSNFTVERGIVWSAAFAPNGDLILPGSGTRSIMRINYLTGDTVWTRYRPIPNTGAECLCVYGNTVYAFEGFINTAKRVMAIDVNTGAIRYYSPGLAGDGDQEIPFTIGPDGNIYVIRDGGWLYALRDNGSTIVEFWHYIVIPNSTGSWAQFGCGTDSNVYIPNGRKIYRINHNTGLPIDSSADLVSTGSLVPRITVGANGLVYVGNGASDPSQGKFYGLTANLQTMWSVTATYNYYCGPALGQYGILVVCGGGTSITAYYTPVGISSNENNTPEGFHLYQNYPNPFNAKSRIKYQISKTSQVKIQLFDMLARMIQTLVNQRKNPGQYEFIIDAGDLPSGTYFYRLEADGYVETRKMILLK